jgi:hypothetical protein
VRQAKWLSTALIGMAKQTLFSFWVIGKILLQHKPSSLAIGAELGM